MARKLITSFGTFLERNCTVAITLDKRTSKKGTNKYPLAVRYCIEKKRYYYHVGGNYTEAEFSEICNVQQSKSPKYETKKEWIAYLKDAEVLLHNINKGHELTLDAIRLGLTGVCISTNETFISFWEGIIEEMKSGDKYTTGESYECALKSFKKVLGDNAVVGFRINKEIIEKWNKGMKEGVMDGDRVIAKPIADATRGIYLRNCRHIWKECEKKGYIVGTEYPFSNRYDSDGIAIPKGATRGEWYITVQRWTELYKVFLEKRYPESWDEETRQNCHLSLGLFLVQYLCNGFNLADAAELTYDNLFFSSEHQQFEFLRKKTAGRSDKPAWVVIPIIEPLQRILDEIAAPVERGARVFPFILKDAKTKQEIRKRVTQENQNIKKRVQRIVKAVLGWEEPLCSTYARHSFATNLRDAGVDVQYISDAMGHATDKTTTQLYFARFPKKKQFEYNAKLLDLKKKTTMADLENLSKEDMQKMLLELLNK